MTSTYFSFAILEGLCNLLFLKDQHQFRNSIYEAIVSSQDDNTGQLIKVPVTVSQFVPRGTAQKAQKSHGPYPIRKYYMHWIHYQLILL